jgi:hypothetical protein
MSVGIDCKLREFSISATRLVVQNNDFTFCSAKEFSTSATRLTVYEINGRALVGNGTADDPINKSNTTGCT